jgi:membrane fusion protein, heavy metal efflux system
MNRVSTLCIVALVVTLGAGCRQQAAAPEHEEEEIRLAVTNWTQQSELFMEYPLLVAGESGLYAVHLTHLKDFTPFTAGRPTVEFTPETGGNPTRLAGGDPSRPGAFRIEGAPPAAGRYRWALTVEAPGLSDRHDLGTTTVFATHDEAVAAAPSLQPPEEAAAISYLKEQQWTNEFATARAEERELRAGLRVPAAIAPVTGGEAMVSAPSAGRFAADSLLSVGAAVRAGATLGRIQPRLAAAEDRAVLEATIAEARAAADAAQVEERRVEQLLADRAVPARRVEDAKRARSVAEARLRAAEARLAQRDETLLSGGGAASGNAFTLRAPISGRVVEVFATLGAAYDEGAPLFRIVKTDEVELRAYVPAAETGRVRNVSEIAFEVPGRNEPLLLKPDHMHDAGILDPDTKSLAVQFEVDNRGGELLVGQSGTAVLYASDRVKGLAVPKAAVLMEAGRPYLFVQDSGESFSRRMVEITTRDGEWIGVKSGVKAGERVVVRGAYEVQLAAASKGLPAEGHVH